MITTYFQNCIMGNLFGTKTSPTLPSTYYLAISTTTPDVSGTGVTEPSGGAYARVTLSHLSEPDTGVISNTQDVEFAESTADWGTMTHFAVFDAATGGNLLMYEKLEKDRIVQSENQVRFKTGTLKFTLKNAV